MAVPTFVECKAGESRQINGPIFGVRTLTAGAGASLRIDGVPVPLSVLLTIPAPKVRPFDRLNLTGPMLAQVAMAEDDDLTASASPKGDDDVTDVILRHYTNETIPVGTYFDVGPLVRPYRARSLEIFALRLFNSNPGGGQLAVRLMLAHPETGDKAATGLGFQGDGIHFWNTTPTITLSGPSAVHFRDIICAIGLPTGGGTPASYPAHTAGRPDPKYFVRLEHLVNPVTFTANMHLYVMARWGF